MGRSARPCRPSFAAGLKWIVTWRSTCVNSRQPPARTDRAVGEPRSTALRQLGGGCELVLLGATGWGWTHQSVSDCGCQGSNSSETFDCPTGAGRGYRGLIEAWCSTHLDMSTSWRTIDAYSQPRPVWQRHPSGSSDRSRTSTEATRSHRWRCRCHTAGDPRSGRLLVAGDARTFGTGGGPDWCISRSCR